ncbi:MAG: hypothetical protein ACRYG8_52625 [Janthinobacterium lividum]
MTMYARVEQGVVRELVQTDQRIEDLYHPDLLWVDVRDTPDVRPGWLVGHEGFAPPEPEDILAVAPPIDIAELVRRVDELREQIRVLASDAIGQQSGEV